MPLPLRNNNQSVDDDAYNEYNQLPGESFYPYPIDDSNQFQSSQSSSMPADDYTLQSHEYDQQLQSQSKVKPSEPQKFEAANLSNWVKNGGSIYNNASNASNDVDSTTDYSYDNVSATDWVDCDLSGADVKRIGFKHRMPSGLLGIIIGIFFAVIFGRVALSVKQSNGGWFGILIPTIMLILALIISIPPSFKIIKGNPTNYDMSNAVGVSVKALLNETGFERICVEPDYYYDSVDADGDTTRTRKNYNIKLITMIPRADRHHYNIYAYNPTSKSKVVNMLTDNLTVNGMPVHDSDIISLILETEGKRVRLLIPDNQDDTTDSNIASNVINSIHTNGISKENIINTMISSAASKAKYIGSHQKDQYIRYDNYGIAYLADSFNDMNVDGKSDDANE